MGLTVPRKAERLADVKRRIAEAKRLIVQQEARVSELQRNKRPARHAQKLLKDYQDTLRLMEAHKRTFMRHMRRKQATY